MDRETHRKHNLPISMEASETISNINLHDILTALISGTDGDID